MTDLEEFFTTVKLPKDFVKINGWTTILNCEKCVEVALIRLKSFSDRPRLLAEVVSQLEELRTYIQNRTL